MHVRVHFLPSSLAGDDLSGATAVVIDVLRATTTITTALAQGAEAVVPCLEVEDALAVAARYRGEGHPVLLGGERGGILIPGFDLGNSPADYSAERVAGRTIVFTTTNGTRAIEACRAADRVLLASMVNRVAVVEALRESRRVEIVCAGSAGRITREDVLAAGALIEALATDGCSMNDEATLARAAWRDVVLRGGGSQPSQEFLARELADSQGGRNVRVLGLEADLLDAAALDRYGIVPVVDRTTGEIRSSS